MSTPTPRPVLIVDDEPNAVQGCRVMLSTGGIKEVLGCTDPREVMAVMAREPVGVVVLDLSMPHVSGQQLLRELAAGYPEVPVVVLTGAGQVETAVECMKLGAFDYMVKPVEQSRFTTSVRRALEMNELRCEYQSFRNRVMHDKLEHPEAFEEIVTNHPSMRGIFQYAETIAGTSRPVLITGETGVGKELVARALHRLSGREGELVTVNVAGLDDTMFSDSLFGHLKGAFTGATTDRAGMVARAAGGTLMLDEIGDMTPASQVKLLRLVEQGEYFQLGADLPRRSDARVVCSTNRDLQAMQREGSFRADLFHRLKTHQIQIPPLRRRLEDLPMLVDHFLDKAARALGKKKPTPPRELVQLLSTYRFPGNIRELEGMVFDAVSHHDSGTLSMERFRSTVGADPDRTVRASFSDLRPFAFMDPLPAPRDVQLMLMEEAMKRARGNQSIAARMLGMTQSGLSKALKRAREDADETE